MTLTKSLEAPPFVLPAELAGLKVAIVHPFLIARGGGEKVIDALAQLLPRAEFFTLMLERDSLSPVMAGRCIHVSALDKVPGRARFYQYLTPLYDAAVARHDLSGFDLVISSGGPGAKTVRCAAGAVHVHYCHSPVRYLWDQYDTWLARLPAAVRPVFALSARAQRRRDHDAARKVDAMIANSDYVGARIRRYYQRASTTIHPPVDLASTPPPARRGAFAPGDFYLSVGRLVPHKRTDLLIEACNAMGRRLIVAGTGPEQARLAAMAGPTVRIMGRVSDEVLRDLFRGARAYLFAADEDFGIATVEALSHGLPVIAYGHGGTLEIVGEPGDGVLFARQALPEVVQAIERFEERSASYDPAAISARARRFGKDRFLQAMAGFLAGAMAGR